MLLQVCLSIPCTIILYHISYILSFSRPPCVATGISSPFNYVRNIHYAVPSGVKAESHYVILNSLWINTWKQPTWGQQWDYMSTRLRIGWGTLRVGCGMGLASQLYSMCKGDR